MDKINPGSAIVVLLVLIGVAIVWRVSGTKTNGSKDPRFRIYRPFTEVIGDWITLFGLVLGALIWSMYWWSFFTPSDIKTPWIQMVIWLMVITLGILQSFAAPYLLALLAPNDPIGEMFADMQRGSKSQAVQVGSAIFVFGLSFMMLNAFLMSFEQLKGDEKQSVRYGLAILITILTGVMPYMRWVSTTPGDLEWKKEQHATTIRFKAELAKDLHEIEMKRLEVITMAMVSVANVISPHDRSEALANYFVDMWTKHNNSIGEIQAVLAALTEARDVKYHSLGYNTGEEAFIDCFERIKRAYVSVEEETTEEVSFDIQDAGVRGRELVPTNLPGHDIRHSHRRTTASHRR